jgi:CheY-like chemotaxis protein
LRLKWPIGFVEEVTQVVDQGNDDASAVHHVLLAEDIPAYLDRIIGLFRHESLRFISALDGQQAIDYIEDLSRPLDLLVTDLDMPRRTGWHVIESLRELRPHVPVIMQTGEAAYPWVIEQAAELGIVLIDKIHVDLRLVTAVEEALGLQP